MGLIKLLCERYHAEDAEAWRILAEGGTAFGKAFCPDSWPPPRKKPREDTPGVDPPVVRGSVDSFRTRPAPGGWVRLDQQQQAWDESVDEVKKGWLEGPSELDQFSDLFPGVDLMLALRFIVEQEDKDRLCDDARGINDLCILSRLIPLPTALSNLALASACYDVLNADPSDLSKTVAEAGRYVTNKKKRRRVYQSRPARSGPAKCPRVPPVDNHTPLLIGGILCDVKSAYKSAPVHPSQRCYSLS